MGELFRSDDQFAQARSFFSKIAQIWKDFIVEEAAAAGAGEAFGLASNSPRGVNTESR